MTNRMVTSKKQESKEKLSEVKQFMKHHPRAAKVVEVQESNS